MEDMTMANETQELEVRETEKQEIEETDAERTRTRPAFVPRADIYETNQEIVVIADMPGVDENSIDITLEKNVLSINGTVEPPQYESYSLAYAEYRVGDFQRRFSLSNEIDQDGIEATVKDGVLTLHLPKVSPTTKRITVKGG
jgi:HSP20 family molecular chaperone IbpA